MPSGNSQVQAITSVEQFNSILESGGDRLLGFDLYADWCMPCRILAPTLEELAREKAGKITIFKVDTDKFPQITAAFGVTGIPFVVFVKNKKAIYALTGVQPKDTYSRIIEMYCDSTGRNDMQPDGKNVEGLRVIRINPDEFLDDIYVIRGENIKFIISSTDQPYTFSVPRFSISVKGGFEQSFRADSIGVFQILSTSAIPGLNSAMYASLIVLPQNNFIDKGIKIISNSRAADMVSRSAGLFVDVRTPGEYCDGYIPNARLLPLQQLETRLYELATYRDSPIVVYCLNDSRSIIAASILKRHMFSDVSRLKGGLSGWKQEGYAIDTPVISPTASLYGKNVSVRPDFAIRERAISFLKKVGIGKHSVQ